MSELLTSVEKFMRDTVDAKRSTPLMDARRESEILHGQDVLRWVLTLEPRASETLQIAALTHDIERIVNKETDQNFSGDRTSPEYFRYKKDHAARSASIVGRELSSRGVQQNEVDRVMFLIDHHDDNGKEVEALNDPELNVLVAADSFSFFTSIAAQMLAKEGEKRVEDKIYFMVEKMPSSLRDILRDINFLEVQYGIDMKSAVIIEKIRRETLEKFTS